MIAEKFVLVDKTKDHDPGNTSAEHKLADEKGQTDFNGASTCHFHS